MCWNTHYYVMYVHHIGGTTVNQEDQPKLFKLVIDNIDMTVKARFMRMDSHQKRSLHYVNSYAVYSRIFIFTNMFH